MAADGQALAPLGRAQFFVKEAFKHGKPIGAVGTGRELIEAAHLPSHVGVVMGDGIAEKFATAVAGHRFHERDVAAVPA
ncbi:hypothetical protein ABGB18_08990 [Nonomuraea sp. B12E4]|uniref:hypothetical protein n=1 Tax=Nonomuraea sp. B12E4 TaxID=3153564 RepID=UPI00325D1ADE